VTLKCGTRVVKCFRRTCTRIVSRRTTKCDMITHVSEWRISSGQRRPRRKGTGGPQPFPILYISTIPPTFWPWLRQVGFGLGSIFLTRHRKCVYPMQNDIGCIHFWASVIVLCSANWNGTVYAVKLSEMDTLSVGITKLSCVLLTLSACVLMQKYQHVASASWPRLTTLLCTPFNVEVSNLSWQHIWGGDLF